ncbi:MAG: sulfurtransferase complex subunit TusB [Rubrivivax sp.]|nr:sulfurtransferase complex subunit TusB [Rubrivivax sp.]MDH5341141.1 sulfurtransferase complex subunit TusB [Rubrivivax sp.]
MLHIVNKSPTQTTALASCLRLAQPGAALLLTEDAVYAATAAGAHALGDALTTLKVYALRPDLEARGMADRMAEGVTPVDYAGFVDLVVEHSSNQSWL